MPSFMPICSDGRAPTCRWNGPFSGKRSARLLQVWVVNLSNIAKGISVVGKPFSVLGLKH